MFQWRHCDWLDLTFLLKCHLTKAGRRYDQSITAPRRRQTVVEELMEPSKWIITIASWEICMVLAVPHLDSASFSPFFEG